MKTVLFAGTLALVLAGCGSSPCAEALADELLVQELAKKRRFGSGTVANYLWDGLDVEPEFDRATEIRRENRDTYCTVRGTFTEIAEHFPPEIAERLPKDSRIQLAYTVRTDTVGELVVEITKVKADRDADGDLEDDEWRDVR